MECITTQVNHIISDGLIQNSPTLPGPRRSSSGLHSAPYGTVCPALSGLLRSSFRGLMNPSYARSVHALINATSSCSLMQYYKHGINDAWNMLKMFECSLKDLVQFHSPLADSVLTLQVLKQCSLLTSLVPLVRSYTGGLKWGTKLTQEHL